MITYEEFMKKNHIRQLRRLNFTEEESIIDDAIILDNPENYIDIAKKAVDLRSIVIPKLQTTQYYKGLREFVTNCNDNIKVDNNFTESTKEEFLQAEQIIQDVIDAIDPQWTTKQKLAYVHYKMGELVTYAPDFNFTSIDGNSSVRNDIRNIWKAIANGTSVCNGITGMQINILKRIGINAKELTSGTHSFMLTETEEGNIITDATWDLSNTLYKARPCYFGITYEQLRQQEEGISNAHKLENPPENVIEIKDQELREIFHSIGITKEDRTFPMPIMRRVEEIMSKNFETVEQRLEAFFNMFTQEFSEEAKHLSETRSMIESCINELGIDRNKIKTKFVYAKDDEKCKKQYLAIHIEDETTNNSIKILNIDEMSIEKIDLQDFDEKYKVHNFDTTTPFWKEYLARDNSKKENNREEEITI